MDGMVLNVIFASSAGLAGCAFGFWVRGGSRLGNPPREGESQGENSANSEIAQLRQSLDTATKSGAEWQRELNDMRREIARLEQDAQQARAVTRGVQMAMDQLQKLAAHMAANVDEHNSQMQAINGELSYDSGPDSVVSVVTRLIEVNAQMQEQLQSAEQKLEAQQQELETQMVEARTDALTKLANRRAFDSEIVRLELDYVDTGRTSSVMMIDVDHFKKINDTHGHQAGDEVLKGVGRVLSDQLSEDDIVCRYGGEEFAVISPNASIEEAAPRAEKARVAIAAARFPFEGLELNVTASVGVAAFTPGESGDELVKRADEALYACKRAGRNCGHVHDGTSLRPTSGPSAPVHGSEVCLRDPLTGLSTQEAFREDLGRRLAHRKRGGETLSVMLLEIDRFEELAKSESSVTTIIKATSQFLKATMREMDHVARYNDKTFALLLPDTTVVDAADVAERLRTAINSCKLPGEGGILKFTVSLAIEEAAETDNTDLLLGRTGTTLAGLVAAGGNQCNVSSEDADAAEELPITSE